jgi:hypothetical protein
VRIGVPVGLIALGGWMLFGRRQQLGAENVGFPEKVEPKSPESWTAPGPVTSPASEPAPPEEPPRHADAEPEDAEFEEPRVDVDVEPSGLDHDVPEVSDDDEEPR